MTLGFLDFDCVLTEQEYVEQEGLVPAKTSRLVVQIILRNVFISILGSKLFGRNERERLIEMSSLLAPGPVICKRQSSKAIDPD